MTHEGILVSSDNNDLLIRNSQKCFGQRESNPYGWTAYAYWKNKAPVNSFSTTWNVPSFPPQKDRQTLFLFPGMQNVFPSEGSEISILQPVLQ